MRPRSSAAFSGCCWTVFARAAKLRWRPAMALEGRRVLFISYTGMLDPLGQSQVLPYLRELAKRGIRFTLISFERPATLADVGLQECEALRQQLAADNINWHWLPYHQKPSLPATA